MIEKTLPGRCGSAVRRAQGAVMATWRGGRHDLLPRLLGYRSHSPGGILTVGIDTDPHELLPADVVSAISGRRG